MHCFLHFINNKIEAEKKLKKIAQDFTANKTSGLVSKYKQFNSSVCAL